MSPCSSYLCNIRDDVNATLAAAYSVCQKAFGCAAIVVLVLRSWGTSSAGRGPWQGWRKARRIASDSCARKATETAHHSIDATQERLRRRSSARGTAGGWLALVGAGGWLAWVVGAAAQLPPNLPSEYQHAACASNIATEPSTDESDTFGRDCPANGTGSAGGGNWFD